MTSIAAGKGNNKKKEAELTGNYFKKSGENLSLIAKSGNRNMTTSYEDNRTDNIALNFVKKFGPDLSVNGNVMYNNSINGSDGTSYYEQYLNAGNTYRYSSNTNRRAGGAMVCGRQDAFKFYRKFQYLERFRRERQPAGHIQCRPRTGCVQPIRGKARKKALRTIFG